MVSKRRELRRKEARRKRGKLCPKEKSGAETHTPGENKSVKGPGKKNLQGTNYITMNMEVSKEG